MSTLLAHPVLPRFQGEEPFPDVPSCEHYGSTEKLMLKTLHLQNGIGRRSGLTEADQAFFS